MSDKPCDKCIQKQKERIVELEAKMTEATKEIGRLKSVLFCIGEKAVTDWEDWVVGIVDRELNGFKMDKADFDRLMPELLRKDVTQ